MSLCMHMDRGICVPRTCTHLHVCICMCLVYTCVCTGGLYEPSLGANNSSFGNLPARMDPGLERRSCRWAEQILKLGFMSV